MKKTAEELENVYQCGTGCSDPNKDGIIHLTTIKKREGATASNRALCTRRLLRLYPNLPVSRFGSDDPYYRWCSGCLKKIGLSGGEEDLEGGSDEPATNDANYV